MKAFKKESGFLAPLLFTVIATALFTKILVGDFGLRIANVNSDDHPAIFADSLLNPENYPNDVIHSWNSMFTIASLRSWAPYLLLKHLGIPAETTGALIVFLQNILLTLALLYLTRKFFPDPSLLWLLPLAVYANQPWSWNLSNYINFPYTPYPGNMVLPFLVFAFYAFAQKKPKQVMAWLTVSCLIHPTLTVHSIAIFTIYLLLNSRFSIPKLLRHTIWILPVFLIIGLIQTLTSHLMQDPLPSSAVIGSILENQHFVPWKLLGYWSPRSMPLVVEFFFLFAIIYTPLFKGKKELARFFWSLVIACVLMNALQYLAVKTEIVPLIMLCPARVSQLCCLFLFVLLAYYLLTLILNGSFWTTCIALSTLLLSLLHQTPNFWGLLLASRLSVSEQKDTPFFKRWSVLIFFLWNFLILMAGKPMRALGLFATADLIRTVLAPQGLILEKYVVAVILALLVAALTTKVKAFQKQRWMPLLLLLIAVTAFNSQELTREIKDPVAIAKYDVQVWAREHTDVGSLFLVPELSWRGISKRPALFPDTGGTSWYMFTRNRKDKLLNDRLTQFYEKEGLKSFERMTPDALTRLASEFGGDYAVISLKYPKALPEVYRNSVYAVYRLKPATPK